MRRKTCISLFILPFLQPPVAWAESSQALALSDSAFLRDSQFNLRLRNHWKYLKENEAQPVTVHNA